MVSLPESVRGSPLSTKQYPRTHASVWSGVGAELRPYVQAEAPDPLGHSFVDRRKYLLLMRWPSSWPARTRRQGLSSREIPNQLHFRVSAHHGNRLLGDLCAFRSAPAGRRPVQGRGPADPEYLRHTTHLSSPTLGDFGGVLPISVCTAWRRQQGNVELFRLSLFWCRSVVSHGAPTEQQRGQWQMEVRIVRHSPHRCCEGSER